ncbi:putative ribonuclease H-like domain-containing protein [Tanacetum coccineum]|uniref:Ribonuclease H-like domain-containing protein n=1 Tax=Tanacetum coccineum TaxID=301880 RepID=A0ABQ5HB22_9ASTR
MQYLHLQGNPEEDLKDYAIIDSGCSGSSRNRRTRTSCLILKRISKVVMWLLDMIRKGELLERMMYTVLFGADLKNIIPSGGVTCLVAKATKDLKLLFLLESVNRKKYCLVVTDDCSRFSWVFFLAYKDETYDMLHDLIVGLENKLRHKGRHQNRTLIEAARTMLADLLLPIQFWAEAVNTACYVLLTSFDQLGKFDGKSEEGYLLGYSTSSKGDSKNGKGPDWMFDLELLTPSMNYIPVRKENYAETGRMTNKHSEERTTDKEVPLSSEEQALHDELVSLMHQESIAKVHNDAQRNAFEEEKRRKHLKGKRSANSTLTLRQHSLPSSDLNLPHTSGMETFTDDDHMRNLSDSDDDVPKDGVFSTNSFDDENTDNEEVGAPFITTTWITPLIVSSTPTLRIHKNHPQSQIIGKSTAGVLTRRKLKESASDQHQALLFQVTPNGSLTCCVKRDLLDCDYAGDNHDRRSTSGGCQLSWRRCSWQCKKQTIVAISSTEAEYVAAASCYNESTICIVKNPVLHSKTKHIQIRHHFIRDCYEQRLINVVKVHTDDNVADLLTKGFDLARFNFLVVTIEETIRADLLFDDTDGVDCFPKQVIWDSLRDIGYEGNLAQLTFSKPLFSPQWKYLVHVLLHCLSPKSTSWEQFGTNIASALNSPKFSGRITPLTPPMLEVITALAAEEAHSESTHSRAESSPRDAQGTPTQSAAQASILQGTAEAQGAADIPQSPNDYTPTDESQTSGGDEGLLDLYALNREKLKKRGKKQKKKVSSVKLGRNKDEGNLSEEHHDQDDHNHTAFVYEDFDATDAVVAVTPDLERKSDETEQVIIEEEKDTSDVKSGDTEELDLERIQTLETAHDEEVARKVQAEWDTEEERKRLEDLKKPKPKTISKKPTSLTQERNQMMSFLKGQGYKNLQKLKYPQMKELYRRKQPSKKLKLRTEKIDELRNYLRIVDFEKSAQDRESLEAISMITEFKVIDSPDGEYLIIYRANNHFRAFNTLWEILHILDRQDLYHLYLVVQDYYKHIPPTGLGLILLLEDGTMLHMLAERRYPLSRELMIRMLDHGMEVEDESETAITLIHLFILWTTEDGDDS